MSLSYQTIGRHLIPVLRVFFITRVGFQLCDIYFNYPQNLVIKDLVESGSSFEAASLKYLLLRSCDSIVPLFALATCIAPLSRLFHRTLLAFMKVDDAESASSVGNLAGWLFIVICFQTGLTSLPDEDRYWRLLRNLGLIVIVNLHSLFKPVSERLESLSTSRSKTIHKHVRVLVVGLLLITIPIWFLLHLWSQRSINSWTLTATVFGFEMISRMSISLVIYTMCMVNSFCDIHWRGLEDQIYYLKASCGMISFLCGISLFVNSTCVLLYENPEERIGWLKGASMCVHLYFNIWNQAWKGWNVFNKRRLASTKMSYLRNATKLELIALDDLCSICFQQLDHAKVTSCNHYFHADCLTRWLYIQDTCPICCSTAAISSPNQSNIIAAIKSSGPGISSTPTPNSSPRTNSSGSISPLSDIRFSASSIAMCNSGSGTSSTSSSTSSVPSTPIPGAIITRRVRSTFSTPGNHTPRSWSEI